MTRWSPNAMPLPAMRPKWAPCRPPQPTPQQQRAPWLPPQVRAERVLDDLQFVLWPAQEIRKALPPQWTLRETGGVRELLRDGQVWLSVNEVAGGRMRLNNRADGYELEIESVTNEATP